MEKIYEKFKKIESIAVTVFCLLFMTVGFLQTCSLTFGHSIISLVQWPTVALGGVIILYRLLNFKHYIPSKGIWLLIAFAVSYIVSTVVTYKYGFYENIRHLIFMAFQFGILYATSHEDKAVSVKRLKICSVYYLAVAALLSIGSFVTLFGGYSQTFYPEVAKDGPIYYIGFHFGRLFGIYWDPNIASVLAVVAMLFSLFYIIRTKRTAVKILLSLNIALQFLYIIFSGSRTGQLCAISGLVVSALLYAISHRFFEKKAFQISAVAAVAIGVLVAVLVIPTAVKIGFNYVVDNFGNSFVQPEDADKEDVFDREYDMSTDVSNRRFDIWGSAVEISKASPIFGVSRANIIAYAKDRMPDTYIVNNDHMDFDSMHNLPLEILVSQGVVGLALFIAFAVVSLVGIIKRAKAWWEDENRLLFIMLLGVIIAVCTSILVMTEIVYVVSPMSTVFWMGLSILNNNVKKDGAK